MAILNKLFLTQDDSDHVTMGCHDTTSTPCVNITVNVPTFVILG